MNWARSTDPYGIDAAYERAQSPGRWRKAVYRRPWFWVVVSLVVLVVGIRIALNPLASHFTQQGLDSIEGYDGTFKSVAVSIIPLTYTIEALKLVQTGNTQSEPLVYVNKVTAQLFWGKLLKLQPVGTAQIAKAKFVIDAEKTKPPPSSPTEAESKKAGKQDDKKQVDEKPDEKKTASKEFQVSDTLEKVIPFRIDRVELRDSEITFKDSAVPGAPSFWVKEIELVMENLVSRKKLDEKVPLMLTMRAVIAQTGTLKVLASADLLADKPAFTGEAQLSGLKLQSLYGWTAAKAGLSAKGTVDIFTNFNSAKGKLSGDVKIFVRNPEVVSADENVGNMLKAKAADAVIKVMSDRVEGREALATTLPIKGSLTKPDPQVWPTILGVVRNAFIQGLNWGAGDLPTPTAEKKEGPVTQAVKALDKDEPAPKAQPTGTKQ